MQGFKVVRPLFLLAGLSHSRSNLATVGLSESALGGWEVGLKETDFRQLQSEKEDKGTLGCL